MTDPYLIYAEKYAKCATGFKLDKANDFGEYDDDKEEFVKYNEAGILAVTLAAQDVKSNRHLRTKSEFNEEVIRLREQ